MKIAVIGAGIGGLTAAYHLHRLGHDVTVFEKEDRPGGLAAGFKEKEWEWFLEKYYHHWFRSDKEILSLLDELGLSENIIFKTPKTVVYHEGKFHPFDSAFAVLKFPGFSLIDKLRFGFVTVLLKYILPWKPLEKYTAVEWIKRFYGNTLYEIFFLPLLVGKFSDNYKEVNMAWFWARFKARSAMLGTYQGGFQAFLDRFEKIILKKGVHFFYNTNISGIRSLQNRKIEISIASRKEVFDQVLATIAPKLLAKLAPELKGSYREKISAQKSIGAVVVIFSLKHKLSTDDYYWFNLPKSSGFPFLALVEHTNYISSEHFNDEHLLYCGDYLDKSHPYFIMSDDELAGLFIPSLKKVNPSFSESWINRFWVFKTPFAQPIPRINHSENILEIKTPLPGLFLASMSQVYPWDRGTNYAVSLACRAVREMEALNGSA